MELSDVSQILPLSSPRVLCPGDCTANFQMGIIKIFGNHTAVIDTLADRIPSFTTKYVQTCLKLLEWFQE